MSAAGQEEARQVQLAPVSRNGTAYVGLLETLGWIDWMGEQVAQIGAPLLAALLIC